MNLYEVLTRDGRHVHVFAQDHEVSDGDLTLYYTQAGVYSDIFPEGYWTRFAVNGEEQFIDKPDEID